MRSYDLPEVPFASEDAQAALNRMQADALADPEHPAFNKAHPQAAEFRKYQDGLVEVVALEQVRQDEAKERAYVEAVENHTTPSDLKIRAEAEAEFAKLRELGFDTHNPDHVEQWQLDCWKMQRLCAEGDYSTLQQMLARQMRTHRVPDEMAQAFRTFSNADLDPESKKKIAETLIAAAYRANQERFGTAQ